MAFYQNSWDDDAWQDYDESWDAYSENWSGYGDCPGDGWQEYAYDNCDEDIPTSGMMRTTGMMNHQLKNLHPAL